MNFPSIKTLERAFPGKGQEIRALLTKKVPTKHYQSVRDWCDQAYNPLGHVARLMCALNEILGGYGVGAIWGKGYNTWPEADYVNMGDTYNTTILYDYRRGTISVTTWGDWVEHNGRRVAQ